MTRKEQKQKAIGRMKLLRLHENAIREFEKDETLNLSESVGILYWLDEKQKRYVREFEEKHKCLVYHVIHDFTEFGELLNFLYVSKYKNEWCRDRKELKQGYACAYVVNLDDEDCSEFGGIGIKPQYGGLVRTE